MVSANLPSCTWSGVSCNDGEVIGLIVNSGVTGGFPEAVLALGHLSYLDFSGNSLTGTIPDDLSEMRDLEVLLLRSNRLSGTLPSALGDMHWLRYLDLAGNRFSGTLPAIWSGLGSLRSLWLRSNQLVGSLPASWSGMGSILTLDLANNALVGSLPATWSRLDTLQGLYLNANDLTGTMPSSWTSLGGAQVINLAENCGICGAPLNFGASPIQIVSTGTNLGSACSSDNCSQHSGFSVAGQIAIGVVIGSIVLFMLCWRRYILFSRDSRRRGRPSGFLRNLLRIFTPRFAPTWDGGARAWDHAIDLELARGSARGRDGDSDDFDDPDDELDDDDDDPNARGPDARPPRPHGQRRRRGRGGRRAHRPTEPPIVVVQPDGVTYCAAVKAADAEAERERERAKAEARAKAKAALEAGGDGTPDLRPGRTSTSAGRRSLVVSVPSVYGDAGAAARASTGRDGAPGELTRDAPAMRASGSLSAFPGLSVASNASNARTAGGPQVESDRDGSQSQDTYGAPDAEAPVPIDPGRGASSRVAAAPAQDPPSGGWAWNALYAVGHAVTGAVGAVAAVASPHGPHAQGAGAAADGGSGSATSTTNLEAAPARSPPSEERSGSPLQSSISRTVQLARSLSAAAAAAAAASAASAQLPVPPPRSPSAMSRHPSSRPPTPPAGSPGAQSFFSSVFANRAAASTPPRAPSSLDGSVTPRQNSLAGAAGLSPLPHPPRTPSRTDLAAAVPRGPMPEIHSIELEHAEVVPSWDAHSIATADGSAGEGLPGAGRAQGGEQAGRREASGGDGEAVQPSSPPAPRVSPIVTPTVAAVGTIAPGAFASPLAMSPLSSPSPPPESPTTARAPGGPSVAVAAGAGASDVVVLGRSSAPQGASAREPSLAVSPPAPRASFGSASSTPSTAAEAAAPAAAAAGSGQAGSSSGVTAPSFLANYLAGHGLPVITGRSDESRTERRQRRARAAAAAEAARQAEMERLPPHRRLGVDRFIPQTSHLPYPYVGRALMLDEAMLIGAPPPPLVAPPRRRRRSRRRTTVPPEEQVPIYEMEIDVPQAIDRGDYDHDDHDEEEEEVEERQAAPAAKRGPSDAKR